MLAAIERPRGASEQVSYAQTDDDRHQGRNEFKAAHEVVVRLVLVHKAMLAQIKRQNRATIGSSGGSQKLRRARSYGFFGNNQSSAS
jgi:hypothetical protein